MIKAITFDLWNTLFSEGNYVPLRITYLAEVLRKHGIPRDEDEIYEAYFSADEYAKRVWEKENYRHLSAEERVNYILEKLRVRLTEKLKGRFSKSLKRQSLGTLPR